MTPANVSASVKSHASPLALLGASGGLGLAVLRRALGEGREVQALVRDREKLLRAYPGAAAHLAAGGLRIVEGDAASDGPVRAVVRGAVGAICCLGAPGRSASRVRSEGTAALVRAMRAEGVARVVAVSVFGAAETRAQLPFLFRHVFFPLFIGPAVEDHERQEAVLAASGLDWTVVRPPSLVDRPSSAQVVHGFEDARGVAMQISRDELAAFMLDELDRRAYVRAMPSIARRELPRAA